MYFKSISICFFVFWVEKVAIHYYGRLAAKQGWRFDSTYDHKDGTGEPIPFEFILGSGKVSPDNTSIDSIF